MCVTQKMSRRDAEIQSLEKWLQQLGYPGQLQPEEMARLLAPNMRSVWRHLKAYVKPVLSAETIRKNLLIAKLRKENIKPDHIKHFKIQSCDELTLVERVSDIQREINSKNIERKTVDDEIKSLLRTITEKKYNLIRKMNTIKEMQDKTALMNMKLGQFQKEIEKLDEEISKTKTLEVFKLSGSYTDDISHISNIATFILNNKVSPLESACKEDKALMLSLSKECSVKSCYRAFLLASDRVYKNLKHFTVNVDIPEGDMKEALSSNGTLSFSNRIKHLNALIICNQRSILDCLEKVKESSAALNEDKIELLNLIKASGNINNDFCEDPTAGAEEFAEKLVNNSISSTKRVVLKELIGELEAQCFEHENLSQLVQNSKNKKNELNEEVKMKVNHINELYSKIYKFNCKVDQVRNEVVHESNESVLSFLSERLKKKDLENVILDSERVIIDEIEMFHDSPLSALTRRWENTQELLPRELIEELSTDPELRVFLLQSEPKNILNDILERKWWLCSLAEQI